MLYAIGLDRSAGKGMREVYLDGLTNVLNVLPMPRRFIYISSTSVYGQTDGSWVDEDSLTEPAEESGRIVLECEQILRQAVARRNYSSICRDLWARPSDQKEPQLKRENRLPRIPRS